MHLVSDAWFAVEYSLADVWQSLKANGGRPHLSLIRNPYLLATALGALFPALGRTLWLVGEKVGQS